MKNESKERKKKKNENKIRHKNSRKKSSYVKRKNFLFYSDVKKKKKKKRKKRKKKIRDLYKNTKEKTKGNQRNDWAIRPKGKLKQRKSKKLKMRAPPIQHPDYLHTCIFFQRWYLGKGRIRVF